MDETQGWIFSDETHERLDRKVDDHKVTVVIEYHAMANNMTEAINRALANVKYGEEGLYPHRIEINCKLK